MSGSTRQRTARKATASESLPSAKRSRKSASKPDVAKVEAPKRASNEKAPQAFYTVDQVVEALRSAAGIKSAAAKKLGCAPSTLTGYFERHPELHAALTQIDEELLDLAEGKLVGHIQSGSLDAIKFFLSTKGKGRGYTKRVESTGKDGAPLTFPPLTIEFVKPA